MKIYKILTISMILTVTAIILLHSFENEISRNTEITKEELSRHVHYLASDELEGRRAGTEGAYRAAEYITNEFIEYGLFPHPDSTGFRDIGDYLQPFEFSSGVEMGENNRITITLNDEIFTLEKDREFRTLPFSSSSTVTGELIFAGFGISARTDEYNDYEEISSEGKVALVFQGSPDIRDPFGKLNQYATPGNKSYAARDAGVVALIIITSPDDGESALMRMGTGRHPPAMGLPVINITPSVADKILKPSGYTSKELYDKLIENRKPNSFDLNDMSADIQTELYPVTVTDHNVIGFLPGNNPDKRDNVIIIGAHYDHLGWGGQGSLVPGEHAVHNGADDNASGTSAMLELAQKFAANRDQLEQSMMFIAFGAEELGLIGSQYFVENPYVPNERITAMINLDMIGRLNNDELTIFGVGSSPIWERLIESSSYYDEFYVRTNPDGFGPSDHASFYAKNIPVLFFHTGLHEDYHRPSDTAEKINYEGMELISKYVYDLVMTLNTSEEPIAFTRAETPSARGTMGNINVYVGTMPDYVGESGGMRVTGVRSDSPAEKAGIKSGDVIIKFGNREIENVYDYTYALGDYEPGDTVEVVLKREEEEITVELELESRRQ